MFDLSSIENDPTTPTFYAVLVSGLFAFFLSSMITFTYQFTTKSIYRKAHFLQAIAMISIIAATVIQAIGGSVAVGMGMLGALSIIRFRSVLDDPRNITFMFASLSIGIACGVFAFSVALVGTLVFCCAAILISFTPLSLTTELIGNLKVEVPKNDEQQEIIEKVLNKYCTNFELNQLRFLNTKEVVKFNEEGIRYKEEISREDRQEFFYLIRLKNNAKVSKITISLNEIAGLTELRLKFEKQPTKL